MTGIRLDKELEQYRNIMLPPEQFEEGFRWSSLVGALFVAMLMVPGALYMQLVAGVGMGPAAQWVTVILFIEVARRAHKHLRRPELYVLFYMAGTVLSVPFTGLHYHQFFVQSQAVYSQGIAEHIPNWYAPNDPSILEQRSFLMVQWLPALGLFLFLRFMGSLNNMILGYGLFRMASDVEKLPFPMAGIGAAGLMALAEQSTEEKAEGGQESWRWRIFSIGGILGLAFGALYLGLPMITGAVLGKPIMVLPIPWTDLTRKTQDFVPAVATGIDWNLGNLVTGMVLPFYAMLGSFLALAVTFILNPLLRNHNVLQGWKPNDETLQTLYKNNIDFYFSFSIGTGIAIALAGFWGIYTSIRQRRQQRDRESPGAAEEGLSPMRDPDTQTRGDIRFHVVLITYVASTLAYILLSGVLIRWHPGVMIVLFVLGFVYTPLISYATARLEGMVGQVLQIPFIREAAFILSGYRGGVDVWFLPVPLHNYGRMTVDYKQCELTGTKFWSIWKTELILVPIVLVASIFFANFIWSLAEIPSAPYPYAERLWEYNASMQCIMYSATMGGASEFQRAFSWTKLGIGTGVGLAMFVLISVFHLPIMMFYGLVRGFGQTMPHVVVPQFIGALLGRYYFRRRLGKKWYQYVPVVAAGFTCGMGLIMVFGVGFTFLAKSVIQLPY